MIPSIAIISIVLFVFTNRYLITARRNLALCELYQKKFSDQAKKVMSRDLSDLENKVLKLFIDTFEKKESVHFLFSILDSVIKNRRNKKEPSSAMIKSDFNDLVNYWMIAISYKSFVMGVVIRGMMSQLHEPLIRQRLEKKIEKYAANNCFPPEGESWITQKAA